MPSFKVWGDGTTRYQPKGETMTVIQLPDDQAAAEGLGLEAWLGRLAAGEQKNTATQGAVSVLDEMNAARPRQA